jgi:hypothetical protein
MRGGNELFRCQRRSITYQTNIHFGSVVPCPRSPGRREVRVVPKLKALRAFYNFDVAFGGYGSGK